MAFKSCFDGYLTDECKNCGWWKDGTDEYHSIGCGCPFPIDHCEAFHKMEQEEYKKLEEEMKKDIAECHKRDLQEFNWED